MRRAPPEVKPIIHDNIEYSAPWDIMGYIQAKNLLNNKVLWDKRIYEIDFDKDLEPDVQYIFIKKILFYKDELRITSEDNKVFFLNIYTLRVSRKSNYKLKEWLSL